MPKPHKGPRLGGSPKHHNMIVANLATELFRHGRITTTKSKAKAAQPVAERMITFAKRGDLHSRRQVLRVIRDRDVVHKLFADIGPANAQRDGGYTRITKLGPRKGDNAEMAMIELVDVGTAGETDLTEAPRRRWILRRRQGTVSRSARERQERIAAEEAEAVAPEPTAPEPEPEPETAEQISERSLAAGQVDDEGAPAPEVTPEEVAARLAEADDEGDEDVEAEGDTEVAGEAEEAADAEAADNADDADETADDDEDRS